MDIREHKPQTAQPTLILLITEDWYFWSHRVPIALAAKDAGYRVIVATREHEHGERIRQLGIELVPIKLRRKSRNPWYELRSIADLVVLYRRERPTVVHHVTIKPVLYGSWAARFARVPAVVNALAGLGHVFIAQGLRSRILKYVVMIAYRTALNTANSRVIFQNPHDQQVFVDNQIVTEEKTCLIRGSGVNLQEFPFSLEPTNDRPIVMLAGRILWEKGVKELVEAVHILRQRSIDFRFVLVGNPDPDNPSSVPEATINEWQQKGLLEWWGRTEEMPATLAKASIVVLPTYGEGFPKVLIEAAAIGRPLVATDVPGCRQIVRHGENGFLVTVHNSLALADAISTLLTNPALRAAMGERGRTLVEAEFSDKKVARQTLAIYELLLKNTDVSINGNL